MKLHWGVKVQLYAFLTTSALGGGEWSASHPGRLIPRQKSPWYPLDGKSRFYELCLEHLIFFYIYPQPTSTQRSCIRINIFRLFTEMN